MSSEAKQDPGDETGITIRFKTPDYEKVQAAARAASERDGFRVTATDIVRSGAIRRAEEILAESESALDPAV